MLPGLLVGLTLVSPPAVAPVVAEAPRAAWAAGERPTVVAASAAGVIAADDRDVVWGNESGVFRASGDGAGAPGGGTRVSDVVASALALDAGALYIAAASGDIWRLPRWGGGKPHKLASTDLSHAMALDERHVYWASAGVVFRVPKSGGPLDAVASVPGAMIFHLAVDGAHAYFTVLRGPQKSGVMRVATRGAGGAAGRGGGWVSPAEVVVDRIQPSNLALDEAHVYVALAHAGAGAGAGSGGVIRVPKAAAPGGEARAVTPIARNLHNPWDLLLAGGFLYILLQEDASGRGVGIVRLPAGGGGDLQMLADRQRGLASLVRGGQRLYWGASPDGDRAGTSARAVLHALAIPQPAVCSGTHIDLDTILRARTCDVPWPRKAIEVPPPSRLETRLEPAHATVAPGRTTTLELSFVNVTARPLPLTVGIGGADDAFAVEVIDAAGKRADRGADRTSGCGRDQIGSAFASRAIAVELGPGGGRLVKRVELKAVATTGCDQAAASRPLPKGTYRLRVHTPFRLRPADATGIAEGELVVR